MPTVIAADGVAIAVHDLGGHGPDLLLAHGTGFHGHVWAPVAEHLRSRFRCLALDQRGHGESGRAVEDRFDWHDMAGDVLAVLDAMGLASPRGVGHSSGASLLLLAEEARPGSFSGLYCYEPIVAPVDDPPAAGVVNPMPARARRRREVFPSREAARQHLAQRPAFAGFAPDALRAYVDHGFEELDGGGVRLKCRAEDEARTYEQGLSHTAFRKLGDVRCPVTLAWGEHTDTVGPSQAERLAARLAAVRTVMVPGVGHLGPMEDPGAVAGSLLDALA